MITSDKPMTNLAIAHQRLYHQQISRPSFGTAEEVVHWLGAVQAQEYSPTLWSIGLRMRQATATAVENAVSEGRILRTHLLRPTWHFVTADDIRWMLALTAPRVHALNAHIYRQLALDDELFLRSQAVFGKALEGGRQLTRAELGDALAQVGIVASGLRLGYIVQRAELDAVLCSGARRGKQFTYALLDERAPQAKRLTRDESLAELTKRYFTSHGPATLKDFVWWSSLTLADARAGVALAGSHLDSQEVNGQTLWFAPATAASGRDTPYADLLPTYDEYISYGDRSAIIDPAHAERMVRDQRFAYAHLLLIDGRIVGTWRRTVKKEAVVIQRMPIRPFSAAEEEAVAAAAKRFADFWGLRPILA